MASTINAMAAVALHRRRIDEHGGRRKAPRQDMQDVADRRPVGEVMTPMRRGKRGRLRLRSRANRPSAASFALSRSNSRLSAPTPGFFQVLDDELVVAARLVEADASRAPAPAARPSGVKPTAIFLWRNIAQRSCASRSFSEKYQWPEEGSGEIRQLPLDPDHAQSALEEDAHLAVQARDCIDVALRDWCSAGGHGQAGTLPRVYPKPVHA